MNTTTNDILTLANRPTVAADGDFEIDGIVYCGKCKTAKQSKIVLFGEIEKTVRCMCHCEACELAAKQAELERKAQAEKIARLRTAGLQDKSYKKWTFAVADETTEIKKAKSYCEKWQQMFAQNIGILFWGDVGRGKSFVAACIANELIEKGVPVLMTNFIKLSAAMQGFKVDSNEYIAALDKYDLLIIDDLGAERTTPTAQENVFNVIDSRYRAGKPLVITTNLTLHEMQNPSDMNYARIYDRIFEMTVPILFAGENRRKKTAEGKFKIAKEI